MKKVLIADDKPEVVELVRVSLEGDYQVIDASDGSQTLKKVRLEKPVIVVKYIFPSRDVSI
jgi:CheY-like chemotaxis protein